MLDMFRPLTAPESSVHMLWETTVKKTETKWFVWRILSLRYWQPGQPNSYNGDQDCGELLQDSAGVGQWNDDGCFGEQNWICEQ